MLHSWGRRPADGEAELGGGELERRLNAAGSKQDNQVMSSNDFMGI